MSGGVSRLCTVARHEFRTAWRRVSTWVLVALLVLLAWGFVSGGVTISTGSAAVGGERPHLNSMFNIAFTQAILFALLFLFFIAVAFGSALLEDDAARVASILHVTPLSAKEYVWGRFLGQLVAYLVLTAGQLAVLALFFELYPVAEPDKVRGAFSLANYVQPTLLFVVAPLVFFGGVSFAVGARTRQAILVFLLPVATLLGCVFFLWSWSPEWLPQAWNRVLQFIDPTGFRWLTETYLEVDRGASFYNTQAIELDGLMWANRILLVAIGLGAVAYAARRERTRARATHRTPAGGAAAAIAQADASDAPGARPSMAHSKAALPAMAQRAPGTMSGFFAALTSEARELRRSPGLFIFVPLIVLQVVGSALSVPGAFDTPLLLTPGGMAASTFNTVTLLSILLLLFYTTESLARDDRCRIAPLVRSSGAPHAAMIGGRLAANCAVVLAAVLGGVYVASVIALTIQGLRSGQWVVPSPWPFLQVWAFFLLPTVCAWLAFVTLMWALLRNRFAVYGAGLAVLMLTGWLAVRNLVNWVFNWHMWSAVRWTDFGPFELDRIALVLNRALWLSLAIALFALAMRAWPRRAVDPQGSASRMRAWPMVRASLLMLPYFVMPAVLAMWLALEIRAGGGSSIARREQKDYWKKNINTWRDVKQPFVDELTLELDLEPATSEFAVRGAFLLRNPEEVPLDRFALTPGSHFRDLTWTFEGSTVEEGNPAVRARENSVYNSGGLWIFTPAQPLLPGATTRVGFSYHGRWPDGIGRTARDSGEFILPSGVVLNSFSPSFLPLVGFVDGIGLEAEDAPESRVPRREEWRERTRPAFGYGAETRVRATIRLPASFRANCPGVLRSDTVEGDRRTMIWETDQPIRFFNVVAGRWKEHRGATTSIWHLDRHDRNIPAMSEALDAAREWYSKWFHPYPWEELRLSEFPGLAGYAQGFGTNIVFSESIGFLARATKDEDAPFLITAHEAAHQWWGNILMPGDGPGGNILSEGMAHFSTARLFEQMRGERARAAFLRKIEDTYGNERRPDDERPMVEIDGSRPGDGTVTYDKGGWVFWMMMELMGRDRFDEGVRAFIAEFRNGPDYPLLQDFVESMRPFADDAAQFDAFVEQWFFQVVVPEFELAHAAAIRNADESWTTTASIRNKGTGVVTVPVAVTNGSDRWSADKVSAYADVRQSLTLGPGESAEISITTPFSPGKLMVDPDVQLLQLNRKLAVAEITRSGGD